MITRRSEMGRDDDLSMKIMLWRYLTEERTGAVYPDSENQEEDILYDWR